MFPSAVLRSVRLWLGASALTLIFACGGGGSSPATPLPTVSISPPKSPQTVGTVQQLAASVSTSAAVTWSIDSGGGAITPGGLFTAPAAPGAVVVRATVTGSSAHATVPISAVAAPVVTSFTAAVPLIPAGGSTTVTPTFTTDGTAVIIPSVGTTVASGTAYTVSPTGITSYVLTVTNSAGTSVSAAATVDVTAARVSLAPNAVTLPVSGTQAFQAVVAGAVNTGITWTASGGTITTAGVYTAPTTPGTYAVVAASTADPTKQDVAAVTVVPVVAPLATIIADTYHTAGAIARLASVPAQTGVTYAWTITNGTLSAGQGTQAITYSAGTPGPLTLACTVTNAVGTRTGHTTVTVVASPVALLFAQAQVHPDDAPILSSVPDQPGSTLAWTLAAGTAIGATTNNVLSHQSPSATGSYNLSVNVQNQAGDVATATKAVQVVSGQWLKHVRGHTARSLHTATLLPGGQVLVVGGLSESGSLASCELFDQATGTFTSTGSLATARYLHTATLLPSGKVLVAGGVPSDPYGITFTGTLASSELFDPATGTWSATGNLTAARYYHTSTLLPNGKVLVIGGSNSATSGGTTAIALASAELYNPATGTWTATGSLATARYYHTATPLPNGKVLVAGGYSSNAYAATTVTELFDPASGFWSTSGSLTSARQSHTATLLPNGKVLVAGGSGGGSYTNYNTSAELFDPVVGTWIPTGSLTSGRFNHTAILLNNGKAIVSGGVNNMGGSIDPSASSEIFDPLVGIWVSTGSFTINRYNHTMTSLPNGKVLVIGGVKPNSTILTYIASAELFDPGTSAWSLTGSFATPRGGHTATLLLNGKVLVAGGDNGTELASAELFDPLTGAWSATGSMSTARVSHSASLLPNGKVLVAGGYYGGGSYSLASAELFDPATGTWASTGSLTTARNGHTAIRLAGAMRGKILVSGGKGSSGTLVDAELYDPATGIWSRTGSLTTPRTGHTATDCNGLVLIVGGVGNSYLASAELFDTFTGTFSPTGSLAAPRYAHAAASLPNGKVLVAGGFNDTNKALASAEIYDPATGTWSATGSLAAARYSHTATLLPNGKVLVVAGSLNYYALPISILTSAELFDPTTGTWTATGSLTTARGWAATSTLLSSGKVMVVGGAALGRMDSTIPNQPAQVYIYPVEMVEFYR